MKSKYTPFVKGMYMDLRACPFHLNLYFFSLTSKTFLISDFILKFFPFSIYCSNKNVGYLEGNEFW